VRGARCNGIPNECRKLLPRRPLVHLTRLFSHCLGLSHFPKPWEEGEFITFTKQGRVPKFRHNLHLVFLLSATAKLFAKVILKIVQRYSEERGLLNASQSGFLVRQSSAFRCMSLTDHVVLNINNNISTANLILDIEETVDIIWHLGLLYELSKLKFSISLIKLISYFLSQRQFRVSVEGKICTPRDIRTIRGVSRFRPVPQMIPPKHLVTI
jgi:hypothetical protein